MGPYKFFCIFFGIMLFWVAVDIVALNLGN
jgi:hypothetical protein